MNEPLTAATGILVLATVAEALVEHIFAPVMDAQDPDKPPSPPGAIDWRALALRYIALAIGVALSVIYRADLLQLLNLSPPWPWIGWVITGLLIGRGSNFIHDFASRWLEQA